MSLLVSLIKPQFELKKEQIGKGGIVREPELHDEAVEKIRSFVCDELGKSWHGLTQSPISGTDGNIEFLAWQPPAVMLILVLALLPSLAVGQFPLR